MAREAKAPYTCYFTDMKHNRYWSEMKQSLNYSLSSALFSTFNVLVITKVHQWPTSYFSEFKSLLPSLRKVSNMISAFINRSYLILISTEMHKVSSYSFLYKYMPLLVCSFVVSEYHLIPHRIFTAVPPSYICPMRGTQWFIPCQITSVIRNPAGNPSCRFVASLRTPGEPEPSGGVASRSPSTRHELQRGRRRRWF